MTIQIEEVFDCVFKQPYGEHSLKYLHFQDLDTFFLAIPALSPKYLSQDYCTLEKGYVTRDILLKKQNKTEEEMKSSPCCSCFESHILKKLPEPSKYYLCL